jgi:hypothetical protein
MASNTATGALSRTRASPGRVVPRHVLYLGEINDTQELAWRRSIGVLEEGAAQPRTLSLFPEDRCARVLADASIVRSSCRSCSCAGHGSGVRAGWRCCCGASCSSIGSGRSGWT